MVERLFTCIRKLLPFRSEPRVNQDKDGEIDFSNIPEIPEVEAQTYLDDLSFAHQATCIKLVSAPLRGSADLEVALTKHETPSAVRLITVTKSYHLKSVPHYVGAFTNITSLNLRDNSLTELPWSLAMLKSLVILDVSYNLLTELPKTVGYLKSLEVLNVRANYLAQLPTSLLYLEHLLELDVNDNKKLVSPPLEVCRKGVAEVKAALAKRAHRVNLWEKATPWFKDDNENYTRGAMKTLFELSVDTVIDCKVDFLSMISVPPVVKVHLNEETKKAETMRIQVCKCATCSKYFTSKVTFDNHCCV